MTIERFVNCLVSEVETSGISRIFWPCALRSEHHEPSSILKIAFDFSFAAYADVYQKTITLSACATYGSRKCIFPFSYTSHEGKVSTHSKCAVDDHARPWCATAVDEDGQLTDIGICDMEKCKGDTPGDGRFSLYLDKVAV